MHYKNKCEYELLNIPQAIDFFKDKDTSSNLLNVAIWDSTDDSNHGMLSYYEVSEAIREAFGEDEVKLHYIEFSGDVIEDLQTMLDLNIHICTNSMAGYDLENYIEYDPCVQEFLDKVYFINAAGNDGDEAICHPAPPQECTVEAADYKSMETPPVGWLAYSNHEEGFTPDCACLTDIWVEHENGNFNGTSSACQTMGIVVIYTYKYFDWYFKRFPSTKETNALTFDNFYIEFDSFYKGVRRDHKLSVIMPDMNIVYGVTEEGEVYIMKTHIMCCTIGNADYTVDGEVRTNMGIQFNKDGSSYEIDVPFMVINGRTQVSIDIIEKLFEEFGTIKGLVADWDSAKPKEVIITFMA